MLGKLTLLFMDIEKVNVVDCYWKKLLLLLIPIGQMSLFFQVLGSMFYLIRINQCQL